MKILVVGSGGREHAIVCGLGADESVTQLHAAPGNPGIATVATCHDINAGDPSEVVALAQQLDIDLVVVGPEQPLVAGVADALTAAGIACFGPSAAAAQLEASKAFAKDVMAAAGVPTAAALVCVNDAETCMALDRFGAPYVVKDDGLAAGKGVVVTHDRVEARAHAHEVFARGGKVVIEEYLDGPELSVFVICDGKTALALAPAQDFKRAQDGGLGPNTGGMGAYSPLPWLPAGVVTDVLERVAQPTLAEMARRGTPFTGVLYCGLALTRRGMRIVEFNVRLGDPEAQVVLARLRTPLAGLLAAAAKGRLADIPPLQWYPEAGVVVVVAAAGYPAQARSGGAIGGLEDAESVPGVHVLHAGTGVQDGRLVATGGRVLGVVGLGEDLDGARNAAYTGIGKIQLTGSHYRRDIAAKAAQGEVEVPV